MGLWDLGFADASVSYEHFTSFMRNLSVAYSCDEEFERMMHACWDI